MLSSSSGTVRMACGAYLTVLILAPTLWGQDTKTPATPPAPEPQTEKVEASPSDAVPAELPKVEPAAQPPTPAATPVELPAFEYSRLAHPAVADQLELTDEQRAAVARLINESATQLAAAAPEQRQGIIAAGDQKLAALLNETQRAKLAELAVEQKLRFNFREQKWADVLDWFARQAGLALVMDQAPQGAFTYTNNRAYTPTEAIDLLNSVLLTKGLTLIRRGRMLILVNLSDDLPTNLIPRVSSEEIAEHGDFEVISVLFKLDGRPADMVVKEIEPLIGRYGTCLGLPQTGQLLVTETAGKMRAIGILIASIPKPKAPAKPEKPKEKPAPPPPVLAVYPVTAIKPQAAVETLSILFPAAKFTVDDKADQVMAYARPDEQTAIKGAVDQMEANRPSDKQPRLEVYAVDVPEPEQMVEQLKAAVPDAQITVDTTLGRLLVFAEPADQDVVKQMVQKLGVSVDAETRQVVVYQPKHFDPAALTTLIKQLAPRAEVSTDTQLRRVVVGASASQQTMIKSLVDQLDSESALEDKPMLQVYDLEKPVEANVLPTLAAMIPGAQVTLSADGRQLIVVARVVDQTVVKKMVEQWNEVISQQEEPELKIYPLREVLAATDLTTIQSLVPGAKVTLTTDGRQLSVVARAADQTAVQSLIEQLTEATAAQEKPTLKVYPLESTLTATDVAKLQSLVPDAVVTLATDGRQLSVVATEKDQTEVSALIKELVQAAASQPKPELKVYPLKRTFVAADVTNLQSLVPGAKITLSTDGRQLNVVAFADDQLEVETLIGQMDQAELQQVKPELMVYPLIKPLNPAVMTTLQSMVPEAKMSLSADARQLIVVARTEDQAAIKKTLDQVSVSADGANKQTLEFYELDGLSAAELQQLLQPLVVHSTITVDTAQNRLIVWGPPEEHTAFAAVVGKLEQDPLAGTRPMLEFYPLEDQSLLTNVTSILTSLAPAAKITWDAEGQRAMVIATPKDQQIVQQTIEQITRYGLPIEKQVLRLYPLTSEQRLRFEAVQTDVLEDLPGARVIKDPQTGELAVWAKASQHEKLSEVLEQLKATGQSTEKLLLISYAINSGSAKAVFDMLQELFPGIKMSLDEKSDRILVHAPLSEHGRIKQSIAQLDVEGAPNNQEELRSYSTGDVDPTPIMAMLQELVPDMQLTTDPVAKKLIAWGRVRDHEVLEKAIEQFRTGDPTQLPVVKAYPMPGREFRSLLYMRGVLAEVVPEAVITIDPRGGSLVASGTEDDHRKLKEAIDEIVKLDRSADYQLETYALDQLTATQAIATLRPIVPDAEISAGADQRQIVVWASAEDHQRIKAALSKLEESAGVDGQNVLRLHRVRPAIAAQVSTFVARTLPNLQLLTGQGTDRLLVWGTPKDQERLAELIEQMNSELGLDSKREMKTYELEDVSATEARRVLDSAVSNLEYVTGGAADRLVIWADAETHAQVAKLLEELKQAVALPQQMIKVHRFAEDEMDVTTVYNALSPDDMKDLSIQVNAVTNSLIVRGPADRQVALSETLAHLVEQLPMAQKPQAVVYRLDRADPSAASVLIRSLLPAVPMAVDVANGTLAITATEKDHAKIRDVLDELDSDEGGELTTETYVLKRANPTYVMLAIKPVVPRATISADIYNKMLIVTATAEDHEQIKAILERADGGADGEMTTKAYSLKYANPYTISLALQTVVPGADVSADTLNKMLIVTASENDHQRIQSVLDEADMRGGGDLVTKAYVLQIANPSTISVALSAVVPNATVSPDVTNKMLVVTASEEDHKRVQAIVDEADRKSEGEVTTVVYALKFANPLALSYSIKPIAPNATASPDVYNKTLVVTATAKDHERIKTMIDQADKRGGGDLTTKAYSVKNANASTISVALTAVVPDATVSPDIYNKMLIVTANQEDHEKIVAVLDEADKRGGGELVTRTYTLQTANPTYLMISLRPVVPDATISGDAVNKMLIVTASEEDQLKVAAVIDEADRRADGELTTKVYSLKWANPSAVSYSIAPIAPNATVSPDVYNKTLIVTATAKDHERIKAVVDQADQRGGGELTTKAYSLKWANPSTVSVALTSVVPDAKISSDVINKMLIVTANEEDHEKIQQVLDQADNRGGGDLVTKAYTLQTANPTYLMISLRPVVPDATISGDVINKMLIVTASEEDQLKVAEVIDEADRRADGELTTQVYSLKWANPTAVSYSIAPIAPNATISPDVYNKTLIVTATAKDHDRIKTIVDQADRRGDGELVTEAYSLKWANPVTLMTALTPVVPRATISPDATNKTLVVTASAADQLLVKKVVEQADRRGEGELTTEVYLLTRADASSVQRALTPLVPDATIGSDPASRTLIITAPEKEQEKIRKIIERADRRGEGELATKVYPFKLADPATVSTALQTLIPNAMMTTDTTTNTLIVTGTAEDHLQVEPLVKQLDVAPPTTRIVKPYTVKNADPQQVYESLTQLFRLNRDVSVGYQEETGMILVFAPAVEQEEVGQAIMDIDKATEGRPKATLEVYPLEGLDGDAAIETLDALLKSETPKIDLQVDDSNNQVLAIAEPAQQELIRKALEQLTPLVRDVEVFTLTRVDPYTADSAISTMFEDLPYAATPSVEADPDNQQLIVRATKPQLERIRQLLEKMGEGTVQQSQQSSSMLRVIPLSGDVESTLREIERLWPQVRGNKIQIVTPPKRNSILPPRENTPPQENSPRGTRDDSDSSPSASLPRPRGGPLTTAQILPAVFVNAQADDPQPRQQPARTEPIQPPVNNLPRLATQPAAPAGQLPDNSADPSAQNAADLPPIVVIAGDGRLTVASRDLEALNQFELLMKSLQRGRRVAINNGNFSMFLLQNADAKELAETITELFRQGSRSGSSRGDYSSSYRRRRSTNLMVVADVRMNALLVYGSASDREIVEQMLDVLDSMEVPDNMSSERPRMIPVKNLPASTVLEVLKSVYQSQLTARRTLRPVTIPQGISPEMTIMLELLNATANSPILTLDTDLTTNSIVMRAPRQLGEEIEEFIQELDERGKDGGTRNISLVPLKGMNSEQVEDALQLLMRGRSGYRRSSYRGR